MNIIDDLETIEKHSRDTSIFQVRPKGVFYPHSVEEMREVMEQFPKDTFSVRAGGTCMSGGSLTEGIVFNMTEHMKDIAIDPVAMTATVGGGAMLKPVLDQAAEFGLMFAPYPSSKDICGIGGMIGNNASGEKSVRLGATIDNVLGLEVLLADGTVIRTGIMENTGESMHSLIKQSSLKHELTKLRLEAGEELTERIGHVRKASSGYRLERFKSDLTPIFIGAQGTLGIATRAVLKLVPIPVFVELIIISVNDLSRLSFILKTITKYNPEAVETFDINTFTYAKSQMPIDAAFCEQFFGPDVGLIVLAEFTEHLQTLIIELQKENIKVELVKEKLICEAVWNIRRHSYSIMRDSNQPGFHAVPCIEDVIVPLDNFDKFILALISILNRHNLKYGFHGHIGEGSLRIIPVFDFHKTKEETSAEIINLSREVFDLVKSLGGNISADHSDGIIRSPFLKEFYGERIYGIFVKIKDLFDPKGRLNKGKKVRSTFSNIKKYLID